MNFVWRSRLSVVAVTAAPVSVPTSAEAQRPTESDVALSRTTSRHAKRALAALQAAIKRDDSVAVSKLFQYPSLAVWDGQRSIYLHRKEHLLPVYRSVLNAELRHIILRATVDSLYTDKTGFAIGRGRVWYQIYGNGEPRIIAVNGPSGRDTTVKLPVRPSPERDDR